MLEVRQLAASRTSDRWLVRWQVANPSRQSVEVVSAWVPHGRFRGEELAIGQAIPPEGSIELETSVRWDEAPGTVVENAFLILRLGSGQRVFARLRVTSGPDGAPEVQTEAVTVSG